MPNRLKSCHLDAGESTFNAFAAEFASFPNVGDSGDADTGEGAGVRVFDLAGEPVGASISVGAGLWPYDLRALP